MCKPTPNCGRAREPRGARFAGLGLIAVCLFLGLTMRVADAGRVARYGGTLQIELPLRPADLGSPDPVHLWGDEGALLGACLYEGLTRWGPELVEPGLAVHWVHNDDATRWSFTLRTDARFHDGARCDAQAVTESLHRLADPRRSPHRWLLQDLVGLADFAAGETQQIEGIHLLSATELELHFAHGVPDLAARLSLPAAAISRVGSPPTGTGPFRITLSKPDTLRCTAFEQYSDGRPFLHTLLAIGAGRSASTKEPMILRRIDPMANAVAGAMRTRLPARRLGLALIHPTSATLADPAARRRVAAEFDAMVFVRAGLAGDGEPAYGLYPDATTLRSSRAVKPDGSSAPTRRPLRVVVPAADPTLHKLGERLQVQLSQLGFEVTLDNRLPETYIATLQGGDWDVAVLGWTAPQGHAALQEPARVLHVLSDLLAPVLGAHLPPAWRDLLEGRTRASETALTATGYIIPLVFFHDVWQAPDTANPPRPLPFGPHLGLADWHLQPVAP